MRWLDTSSSPRRRGPKALESAAARRSWKLWVPAFAGMTLMAVLGLAQAKDTGKVFVSSEKDNALAVLDGAKGELVASPVVCKRPRHMQLSPDRAKMYIACSDDHRVAIWDIAAGKVVARLSVGEDPEMFDLSPDGRMLYVSNEEDSALTAFDLGTSRKAF